MKKVIAAWPLSVIAEFKVSTEALETQSVNECVSDTVATHILKSIRYMVEWTPRCVLQCLPLLVQWPTLLLVR